MDWDLVLCCALVLHPITVALCMYAFRSKRNQ